MPASVLVPRAFNESAMIPVTAGQAVETGWPYTGGRPLGVTWHWTVTWDLAVCRQVLGGAHAERKGQASAHYGVGRTLAEGVDRYVSLGNRSWHAGINQTVRWDGRQLTSPNEKGSRTTIGVETVNIGPATENIAARPDWIRVDTPDGRQRLRIQPWTEEQITLMIEVGKEIVAKWPNIGPRDHHGHHDLCPGYKIDVLGFPFARVLRGVYDDPSLPDVWSPLWTVVQRQRVLVALGYPLGASGADGKWGPRSAAALRQFQSDRGLFANGNWNTFTSWKAFDLLAARGLDLAAVAGPAA